jgi:hypothetical protein
MLIRISVWEVVIFNLLIVAVGMMRTKPWRRDADVTRLNTVNSASGAVDV